MRTRLAQSKSKPASPMTEALLNGIVGNTALIDRSGKIVAVNKAWRRFAKDNGYGDEPASEACGLGANYIDVCDQSGGSSVDEAAAVASGIRRILDGTADLLEFEYPCHSPTELRWFKCEAAAFPIVSDGQEEQGVLVQHVDVTEQVKGRLLAEHLRTASETRLNETTFRLLHLFDAMPVRIAKLDRGLRYRFANKAFLEAVGRTDETLIGRSVADVLGETASRLVEPYMVAALRGRTNSIELDAPIGPSGRFVGVVTYIPDTSLSDTGDGLFVVVEDQTEIRSRQEKLNSAIEQAEAASAAKTRFLAVASHELRTPLNAIIGFADMLCGSTGRSFSETKRDEYLGFISESGRHLMDLLTDILDMSAVEAGATTLEAGRVDVVPIAKQCIDMLQWVADRRGVRCERPDRSDLPPVRGDAKSIKQILINLLTNAIKFTPKGGTVRVTVSAEEPEWITLSVIDTGVGIAPESLGSVLEPFQTLGDPLMTVNKGWGLGLSISRVLAERLGGKLRIESEEGVGTVVSFDLPSFSEEPGAAPSPGHAQRDETG